METLWRDVRYAARMLAKNRGFTFAAVSTLALGIGATTTIFTVVHSVLFPAYPFPDPDRIVDVSATDSKGRSGFAPSLLSYVDWRVKNDVFEELTAWSSKAVAWVDQEEPERVRGAAATANIFRMAGVRPLLGRDFDGDADQPGKRNVVVLGHRFWQRRYGGQTDIIGRNVTIDKKPYTVIGVMPPDKGYPEASINYWIPWVLDEDPNRWTGMIGGGFTVVGRLKQGVSLQQAQAAMSALAVHLAQESGAASMKSGVKLTLLTEAGKSSLSRSTVWTLFGAVLFVLLIACVNVANLLLARASVRAREIAVRVALGAARIRIVRQLLTECLLLSLLGGITGLLLARWGVRLFLALKAARIPGPSDAGFDPAVLAFGVGVSMITALLFGSLPSLQASKPHLVETLKQGGGTSGRRAANRVRAVLVVTEMALALILLAGAGLMMKSFVKLQMVELGFDPQNVITLRVTVPELEARKTPARARVLFVDELLKRFERLPQVRATAASSLFPLDGSGAYTSLRLEEAKKNWRNSEPVWITEGYFRAMGIPLLRGRTFTDNDGPEAPPVVILSRQAAQMFWPGENPLGKKVWLARDAFPHEVVGVSGNARYGALQTEYGPKIYIPMAQLAGGFPWVTFMVRTAGDPRSLVSTLRREVWAIDPKLPIDAVQTLKDLFAPHIARPRFYLGLFGFFALVAVLMAAIGIYGLINYSVGQRTQEIGIRMAIGAQSSDVLGMVLKHGLLLALIGVAVGLAGALYLMRFVESFLFGVVPTDMLTLGVVSAVLVAVAACACLVPARRAAKIDPAVALRCE